MPGTQAPTGPHGSPAGWLRVPSLGDCSNMHSGAAVFRACPPRSICIFLCWTTVGSHTGDPWPALPQGHCARDMRGMAMANRQSDRQTEAAHGGSGKGLQDKRPRPYSLINSTLQPNKPEYNHQLLPAGERDTGPLFSPSNSADQIRDRVSVRGTTGTSHHNNHELGARRDHNYQCAWGGQQF